MKKLLSLLFLIPCVSFAQLSISPEPTSGIITVSSNSSTVYFANSSSTPVVMNISLVQPGFSISLNRCSGKTLSKNQNCYIMISISESSLSSGVNLAEVKNGTQTLVTLSKTKTSPVESSVFSQSSLSFSDFLSKDLIIQNKTLSAKSYNPSISGLDSSKFEILINRCSNVPVNGTCRVSVRMKPQEVGTYSASLTDSSISGAVSLSGIVSGTTQGGVLPSTESFSVSSSSIDFGTLTSFSTTSSRVLTLTNTGNAPLSPSVQVSPKTKIILNRCSSLPVGGSCSITLALSPTSDMVNGAVSESITV